MRHISLLVLLALLAVGCTLDWIDPPDEPPHVQLLFEVDSTSFTVQALDTLAFPNEVVILYGAPEPIRVTLVNSGSASLFLPLCGGSHHPPVYERLVGDEWKAAIVFPVLAQGCTSYEMVAPSESYSFSHTLDILLTPRRLPLDGPDPSIGDVAGVYRLKFGVYSEPWVDDPSPEALVDGEESVSNTFQINVR